MTYGYSQRIVALNQQADSKSLGVILGRVCIKANTPVQLVSEKLGVSRTTVYNWFVGAFIPHPKHHAAITKLLKRVK